MISNLLNISLVREETAVQFSILQNMLQFSRLCSMPVHLKIICVVKSWNIQVWAQVKVFLLLFNEYNLSR